MLKCQMLGAFTVYIIYPYDEKDIDYQSHQRETKVAINSSRTKLNFCKFLVIISKRSLICFRYTLFNSVETTNIVILRVKVLHICSCLALYSYRNRQQNELFDQRKQFVYLDTLKQIYKRTLYKLVFSD